MSLEVTGKKEVRMVVGEIEIFVVVVDGKIREKPKIRGTGNAYHEGVHVSVDTLRELQKSITVFLIKIEELLS